MLGAHTKKLKKSKSKTCISGKNRTQTTNQWSIIYRLTQDINQ